MALVEPSHPESVEQAASTILAEVRDEESKVASFHFQNQYLFVL